MNSDWEEYELKCEEIRKENEKYLELFLGDLQGLSSKTITNHLNNVDFYINEFLLRNDTLTIKEGVYELDDFLGYFFIRKCMWSTPGSIKTTAASIKKFYKSMFEHGIVEKTDYDYVCNEIKENMDHWMSDCAQFNDPDQDNPFAIYL
ncbi:MAG TPA: recombinase [Lachnospiraceae bacterium]|nr:recombinase [Lachnospiraceae bacterium]